MLGYGWYIVLAVLVLIGTAAAIYERNNYADWCILICAVVFVVATVMLFLLPIMEIGTKASVALFERQKAYIENHIPIDPIENAAITNKKIELNEWLFAAQYSKSRFGDAWTFTPSDILDWQPIQ